MTLIGLKPYEVMTLVGIVLGPIAAVIITLLTERYRAKRERQVTVFRHLLATLKLAGDASWSAGMNMLLVEFNDDKSVMDARREYMAVVRQRAAPENQEAQFEEMAVRQIALVYRVARSLGYNITEGELRTEAYLAEGMLLRDNALVDSWKAMRDVATALQRQNQLTEAMLGGGAGPRGPDQAE